MKRVVLGERENTIGAVLFHQAVGQILDVNVTDMKCLDILSLRRSATPSQLAALTGLSTGSTTAMLDRLEQRRLIARRRNPADRRGAIIVLAPRAIQVLPALFASLATAMEELASSYTERQLSVLVDFFSKATRVWTTERDRLQSTGKTARGRRPKP